MPRIGAAQIWRSVVGIAVPVVLVAVAFRDVVFSNRTFSTSWEAMGTNGFIAPFGYSVRFPVDGYRLDPGASAWQFEPWAQVVHGIVGQGQWPLWNPYQGGGAPLAANMSSGVFDPLMLLVHLHPSLRVWDLSILLWLIAGIWLAYLYLRSIDFGMAAAIAGGAMFGLSGFFFLYSNNQFFRAYLFIPLALLLVDKVIRSDRLRWIGLLGAAVAGNLLVGMPESSLAVLSVAGAYALFRLATFAAPGQRVRACVRLAAAGALGLCLAAPLLLLFLQYASTAQTHHAPGAGVGLWQDNVRYLLLWIVPQADGNPAHGVVGGWSGARDWIGAGALMLVLFGLCSSREMRRRPGIFFVAVGLILLLKVYGFPLVQWLGMVPGGSQANFPQFFVPACAFCLAVLAASGVQAIADGSWNKWAYVLVLVAMGFAVAWLIAANSAELATKGTEVRDHFGLAAIAAAVVLLAALALPRPVAPWVATAAVLGELLLLAPSGIYATRANPYVPPPWLTAAGYTASGTTDRVFAFDAKLFPDIAGVYKMQDIRALDALYPDRYFKYITTFIQPDFGDRFEGGAFSQAEGSSLPHIAGNPMIDLLGVRYVVAGDRSPEDPYLTPIAGTVAARSLRLVSSTYNTHVYENQNRVPRATVAHNLTHVADMKGAVLAFSENEPRYPDGAVRVTHFNPRSDAVVEGYLPSGSGVAKCNQGGDATRITHYSATEVSVDVTSGCGGLLVLSDTFYPGWEATVNGKAAPIYPTDIMFRGVPINGGHSVVAFRYRPANFGVGLLLASGGLLALAAAGVIRRIRRPAIGFVASTGSGPP